jgi:hypothetical protein
MQNRTLGPYSAAINRILISVMTRVLVATIHSRTLAGRSHLIQVTSYFLTNHVAGSAGMVLATLFVTLPYVARELIPILEAMDMAQARDRNWAMDLTQQKDKTLDRPCGYGVGGRMNLGRIWLWRRRRRS